MKIRQPGILHAALLLLSAAQSSAQEFAREISQFVGANAHPFLQPVVDALHTDMQAGLFAPVAADGMHVGVQLVAMGISIPDDQRTFKPKPYSKTVEFSRGGIVYLGDLDIAPSELPTAAGLNKRYTFTGRLKRIRPKGLPYVPNPIYDAIQQDATVSVGGDQDLSTVLLATAQVTLGSVYGTEVMVRFLPRIKVADVGEVKSFGVGVKHLVSRYLNIPVDVTASVVYQNMTLMAREEEFTAGLDAATLAVQLHAGKSFPLGIVSVTPYAGVGFESGNADVQYDFADPYIGKQQLRFESGGRFRFLCGVRGSLWKMVLGADYNLAVMNGFAFTLGFEWQ